MPAVAAGASYINASLPAVVYLRMRETRCTRFTVQRGLRKIGKYNAADINGAS